MMGEMSTAEELAQLANIFPQVGDAELRRSLLTSRSVEEAIETLLGP